MAHDAMFLFKNFIVLSRNLTKDARLLHVRTCNKTILPFTNVINFNRTMKGKKKSTKNCHIQDVHRPLEKFVSVDLKSEIHRQNSTNSNAFSSKEIDFENHVEAFKGKSTAEILRALYVLRICAVNIFVDNSLKVMTWSKRAFGRKGLRVLFKSTFYNQFVGGETPREIQDCMKRLYEIGIQPMLAATVEEDIGEGGDEKVYDCNSFRILECLDIASAEPNPYPMVQLKMSGLLPADILVIIGKVYTSEKNKQDLIKTVAQSFVAEDLSVFSSVLDQEKITLLKNALKRLKKIGEEAKTRGVKILVDAEFTYLNAGLSLLTMAMVATFNKDIPVIWNTYQCYLKNALSKVEEETELAKALNVCLGAKLVRGAYMVQERLRANKLGVQDPVCTDWCATNANYNKILKLLLNYTKQNWPKFSLIIASHNEESIKIAIEKMKELGIDQQNGGVCFGQLYGMCDQITYPLASSGYQVYKSIPYGQIDEVLPYLVRRAQENKSVLDGSRKEQTLLWKEVKHRLGLKLRRHT